MVYRISVIVTIVVNELVFFSVSIAVLVNENTNMFYLNMFFHLTCVLSMDLSCAIEKITAS